MDAAPSLQVLGPATPNAHAVAGRYATADHFFSDGEASIQGHWWTSSADSNDYIEKSWRQYYSPRGRPQDSAIVPVTSPPGCSIFQKMQAFQNSHPQFTFENYGELVGLVTPTSTVGEPQANLCGGVGPAGPNTTPFSDPNYPTQAQLTPDDRTRAAEFLKNSGLTQQGTDAGNGNSLRNFNYLIMSEDHTSGLGGTNTPRSQVAQNDAGVGQIISALSKSKYWSSTAVFVTEDDSQDGVDHVDGHRNILLLASPYAKQVSADSCLPGYVAHSHYDQAGVLRTIELILGVTPLSAYDAGATPLYDMFQNKDAAAELSKADLAPLPGGETAAVHRRDRGLAAQEQQEPGLAGLLQGPRRSTPRRVRGRRRVRVVAKRPVRPGASRTRRQGGRRGRRCRGRRRDRIEPQRPPRQPGRATSTSVRLRFAPVRLPGLSTVTGAPLTGDVPACEAHPVPVTRPVPPGQTHLAGMTTHRPKAGSAALSDGTLAFTGLRTWTVWLALGLVLTGGGALRWRYLRNLSIHEQTAQ